MQAFPLRHQLTAGAIALLALSLSPTAHAQSEEHQRPFAIKYGALISGSGSVDFFAEPDYKITSNTEPTWGLSFETPARQSWLPIRYGLYFEKIQAHHNSKGVTGNAYGLGVQGRYLLGGAHQAVTPYLGIGLGDYHLLVTDGLIDPGGDGIFRGAPDEKWRLGEKLMAGIDTRTGVFAEIAYLALPSQGYLKLSGTMASVGYRF